MQEIHFEPHSCVKIPKVQRLSRVRQQSNELLSSATRDENNGFADFTQYASKLSLLKIWVFEKMILDIFRCDMLESKGDK